MTKHPIVNAFAATLCLATLAAAPPARAQGAIRPIEALIVNPPAMAVPVTGTVKSGDKNMTAYDQFVTVDTPVFGNHAIGPVDVADFKEVRVSVSRSSCGPCSQVEVMVRGLTAGGRSFQIDQFVADQAGNNDFPWASRTYSVPGSKLVVSLRALNGGTSQSVLVAIVGRAN